MVLIRATDGEIYGSPRGRKKYSAPMDRRGIPVCDHYGCPIKAGYARQNLSPWKNELLCWLTDETVPLSDASARCVLVQFTSNSDYPRQAIPWLIGTRLSACRRFHHCFVIKFRLRTIPVSRDQSRVFPPFVARIILIFQLQTL